ncbi:hypothetical protein CLU83_3381 [Flavobacterium sp. 1]|uniref:hypothetical protein n=1 Tax=Flavobacterium sp. 1 TaxID=2035200 RepID=UPI000C24A140|nr:hypothetical protein [Flavobacterium sp. 1]PJJ09995.1 hypothetical protein CLU83_3381 [Flavobacterium sp. 1]
MNRKFEKDMSKRKLMYSILGWFIITIIEYYFIPYYIVVLLWIGFSLTLLIITIIQLLKLVKEHNSITKLRIQNLIVFSILFYLTFNRFHINSLIEKVDWRIFYNNRMEIVQQVKQKELNPNVSWNETVCELPFELPVISNGGNDIAIHRNEKSKTLTVDFWVYRNFFSAPSTFFVYTDDKEEEKELKKLIANDPNNNWKIDDNWYRIFRE